MVFDQRVGFFESNMSAKSAFFCNFICSFISMNTNEVWYLSEKDSIIFGKSSFFKEFCDKKS